VRETKWSLEYIRSLRLCQLQELLACYEELSIVEEERREHERSEDEEKAEKTATGDERNLGLGRNPDTQEALKAVQAKIRRKATARRAEEKARGDGP